MKKIFINKNDDPAFIVESILQEKDKDIVLVVPKFSKLVSSVSNFHLIKRESDEDQKNIIIESVDDEAIALAQAAKIPGLNPFLSSRKSMSDIISPQDLKPKNKEPKFIEVKNDSEDFEDSQAEKDNVQFEKSGDFEVDFSKREKKRRKVFSKNRIYWAGAGSVVVALAWVVSSNIFPSTSIAFTLKQYPFETNEKIIVKTNQSDIDFDKNIIGGELFSEKKNISLNFPASGTKNVERKSTGKVIIYNAYSSKSQPLVATTRLLTPEGKLFRLVKDITVPGAKIEQGKIIPSSIEAEVISDKGGEEYNIGPVSRFSIPGLQGSSKYESFYAESKEAMSGGFVGTVAFPKDDDIKNAKEKIKISLEEISSTSSSMAIPDDFEVISGASDFEISKIEVNEQTNEKGEFSVFAEATNKIIAFKKSQLLELVSQKSSNELGFPVLLEDFSLNPSNVETNFSSDLSSISFNLGASMSVFRNLSSDKLKEEIKGKTSSDLKAQIVSIAGIENAKVSFWPFWIDKISENSDKIKIIVNKD